MRWIALLAALGALALSACVSRAEPPLPRLAAEREQPVLALFEHVIATHFARTGAGGPAICAVLRPGPLSAAQEDALVARFARLVPAARCAGGRAVEVYGFSCPAPTQCVGWVAAPDQPATRYAMVFESSAWRFTGDPRLIAE